MKTSLLVLGALLTFGNLSLADQGSGAAAGTTAAPASSCKLLRNAIASVTVTKKYWVQDSGVWVQKSNRLVTSNTEVPVFEESLSGCHVDNALVLPDLMINGVSQKLSVSAEIGVQTAALHPTPYKTFSASYYLSTDSGRSGYASAYTPDLSTKTMGLNFNREHATSSAHDESVIVNVDFTDNN